MSGARGLAGSKLALLGALVLAAGGPGSAQAQTNTSATPWVGYVCQLANGSIASLSSPNPPALNAPCSDGQGNAGYVAYVEPNIEYACLLSSGQIEVLKVPSEVVPAKNASCSDGKNTGQVAYDQGGAGGTATPSTPTGTGSPASAGTAPAAQGGSGNSASGAAGSISAPAKNVAVFGNEATKSFGAADKAAAAGSLKSSNFVSTNGSLLLQSRLIALTNDNGPPPPPVIGNIDSSSVIGPGGIVYLNGQNFLAADGTGGTLLIKSQTFGAIQLQNVQWSDTDASGIIPADIVGAPDDPAAQVWVQRSDGMSSNLVVTKFTANRDYIPLPPTYVKITCSPGGDRNQCPAPSTAFRNGDPSYSVSAYHGTTYGHDSDTDQFSAELINGWTFMDLIEDDRVKVEINGKVEAPQGFVAYTDKLHIYVHWRNDPGGFSLSLPSPVIGPIILSTSDGGETVYGMQIYISGPKGVPYR